MSIETQEINPSAETFFNVATASMFNYMGDNYHANSHGEGNLRFLAYDKPGLYLMDEPEAALSPMRQLTLLAEIDRLVKEGSQLIIATHSPILMAYPGACIYELSEQGIAKVAYKDTEHYRITKQFLDAPERMLRYLIEP